jgi:hypothetical protein
MLFAIFPLTNKYSSVWPDEFPMSLFLVVQEMTFVPLAILPGEHAQA